MIYDSTSPHFQPGVLRSKMSLLQAEYILILFFDLLIRYIFFFFFLVYIFIFRERARWGRERERDMEKPSRLCTVSAESDVVLELTNCEIMT